MSRPSDNHPAVRKVVLPSGKTIEIVYFAEAEPSAPAGPGESCADLHVCPDCDSSLVYPTGWEEEDNGAWLLILRCPNCEWDGEGSFDRHAVARLDEELDNGTQALVRDLRDLSQANMEDEAERFITALHAEQIWPIDF
jgi:hypothetical protein